MSSWNPVLDKFIEVKKEYIDRFGQEQLYQYEKEKENCLSYWIRRLENPRYTAMFAPLKLTEYENLLQIHYMNYNIYKKDMYSEETDFWKRYDGFYNECRSVVLDIYRDCLVLTPFRKFRNLNESEEYSLDVVRQRIAKARVVEITDKLDGSLQFARYYENRFVMAGSHSLNPGVSWRLADGMRMLEEEYQRLLKDYPTETFIFEYVSEKDAHVVSYKKEEEGLYLVGIRSTETGVEWPYQEVFALAEQYHIPSPKRIEASFEEILSTLQDKKAEEAEGYVINIDGFKVKIKFDDFVTAHHAVKAIASPNGLIQAIAEETYDDLFSKLLPKYREQVKKNAGLIYLYIEKRQNEVKKYVQEGPKKDRREFMLWVSKSVPAELQYYVRKAYANEEYNVLYTANGRCVRFSEIENYMQTMREED